MILITARNFESFTYDYNIYFPFIIKNKLFGCSSYEGIIFQFFKWYYF